MKIIDTIKVVRNGEWVDEKVYFKHFDKPLNAKVKCNHILEITGNTGDEHGLAIEDQQALIPRIQGQSLVVNGVFKHSKNNLISTGRNIWDEQWQLGFYNINNGEYVLSNDYICSKNYINIVPNTTYYLKVPNPYGLAILWYDANKNYISYNSTSNSTVISPLNARYGMIYINDSSYGNTYNNDICINISDESFNGTYEPYKQDIIEVNKELKAFDYIQSSQKVVATGEYTFTGNENISKVNGSYPLYQISLPSLNLKDTTTNLIIKGFTARSVSVTSYSVAGVEAQNGNLYFQPNPNEITTIEQMAELLIGEIVLYETATPTITDIITLPAGYGVYKGGYQIQSGEVPYILTKEYSLNTKSQVLANIEIDREQQSLIDYLNGSIYSLRKQVESLEEKGIESPITFNVDDEVSKIEYDGKQTTELLFDGDHFKSINNIIGDAEQPTQKTITMKSNILTTAPTSANTTGVLKFVLLNADPSTITKYDGYLYLFY